MIDKTTRGTLAALSAAAREVIAQRDRTAQSAAAAIDELRRRRTSLPIPGGSATVIPLGTADADRAAALVRASLLPPTDSTTDAVVSVLSTDVPSALEDVRRGSGLGALFAGRKRRDAASAAEAYLEQVSGWLQRSDAEGRLRAIDDRGRQLGPVPLAALTDPTGPLAGAAPDLGNGAALDLLRLGHLPGTVFVLATAIDRERATHAEVHQAGNSLRDAAARASLETMDVERLRDVTGGQLRLGPLRDAGVTTIGAVLRRPVMPGEVPGVGEATATRINAAAQTMLTMAREDTAIRIDPAQRGAATDGLVRALRRWEASKSAVGPRERALVDELRPLADLVVQGASTALVLPGDRPAAAAVAVLSEDAEDARLRAGRTTGLQAVPTGDDWQDFLQRPAAFFALLDEAGLTKQAAATGDLDDDLIARVEAFELDSSRLRASLRGYQRFAAAFALVQERVVIGDEMGLGKTVEALATIAHVAASRGSTTTTPHFLVICPAAVVANWVREAQRHTDVRAHRLHGPARLLGLRHWSEQGGIAVTTYETLEWLRPRLPEGIRFASVIVDEAHYVKNPEAKRTRNTRLMLEHADRAILMSGTPLENRVDEFRVLVDHIRPDLVVDQTDDNPLQFRKDVAPVYLRRRQEDVLTELPELVEVDEWTDLTDAESRAYADAVARDDFHRMRQVAMLDGPASSKVDALRDIVEEARENGRKTLVFSYYRAVLDIVTEAVGGTVFGPLTGSTPAPARQELVDAFSAAAPGAVLVAQIEAGGVGLNIQAASVVVICEPQLKPTTEWQAIARSRRMGQLQSVQVHRLLSEDAVDEALVRLLARKTQVFEDFAAVSETAGASAQAVDVSDTRLVQQVLAEERARLAAAAAAPGTADVSGPAPVSDATA